MSMNQLHLRQHTKKEEIAIQLEMLIQNEGQFIFKDLKSIKGHCG